MTKLRTELTDVAITYADVYAAENELISNAKNQGSQLLIHPKKNAYNVICSLCAIVFVMFIFQKTHTKKILVLTNCF